MHGTAVQARSCYIEAGKELAGIIRVQRKTLKNLIQRARRKESFTFDVAFAVYCQSRGDAETMTVFFHQNRQVFAPCTFPTWTDALERRYLDTSVEPIADIIGGGGDLLPTRVHRRASKWLNEYELYKWALQKNCRQGIAPSYASLARERESLRVHNESCAEPVAAQCDSPASSRWRKRFRRNWDLQTGTLPAKDVLPVQCMRQKARTRGSRN